MRFAHLFNDLGTAGATDDMTDYSPAYAETPCDVILDVFEQLKAEICQFHVTVGLLHGSGGIAGGRQAGASPLLLVLVAWRATDERTGYLQLDGRCTTSSSRPGLTEAQMGADCSRLRSFFVSHQHHCLVATWLLARMLSLLVLKRFRGFLNFPSCLFIQSDIKRSGKGTGHFSCSRGMYGRSLRGHKS